MESRERNQVLLLRLGRIWWAGVKVFCRWGAFWIVLGLLWLPAAILIHLVGEQAGRILAVAFLVLCVPVVFYLSSRYLLLLGEDDRDVHEPQESSSPVVETADRRIRAKIGVSAFVAFFIILLWSPPDRITQFTLGGLAALLCAVPLLILTRLRFMKSASPAVHTLVATLLCMLAVLFVVCLTFARQRIVFG